MSTVLKEADRVLSMEANAVNDIRERIKHDGEGFLQAVDMIMKCKGKVVVTGMGKSGQIGQKIASTFSSTGTPALFVHPAESAHGDLGVIAKTDMILAISNGGESLEIVPILNYAARRGVPVIAMTGKPQSTLGKAARAILDISVSEEACPLKLAPTSSSTVTLALGDALAMCVLKEKGFQEKDYAEFHPGGKLGRRLLTRVSDVMHSGDALPLVNLDQPFTEVISAMTAKEVRGVAGVVDSSGALVGAITDGDIRRKIKNTNTPLESLAKDLMSENPKTIDQNELGEKALFIMQQFRIQTLFAIDKSLEVPKPVGLLHIQDLLSAGL